MKKWIGTSAGVLVLAGAINWGLIGLGSLVGTAGDWNIVHQLLGQWTMLEAGLYFLVGVSALIVAPKLIK